MRIERHPKMNVWVREDGCIFLPQSGTHKAKWTFGSRCSNGYMSVHIRGIIYKVHRIVLETFVGPCPDGMECDHKDRNRSNNHIENLRWVTKAENQHNTSKNDRVDARFGTHRYEDENQYRREYNALYRQNHREAITLYNNKYRQGYNSSHKCVRFSDGSKRWIPANRAIELLKLPVKERTYV